MDRRKPDPLKERISALPEMPKVKQGYGGAGPLPPPKPTTQLGRAVQEAFGNLPTETPLPIAAPVNEATKPGGFTPARPYKRTPSPNPAPPDLAPEWKPESVREARREGERLVAEVERRESIRPAPAPVLDSIKIELPANLKGGIGALGKAILGAIAAALVGGGGAMVGSKATTDALPAPMAIPCQQRCPLGNKQPIPPGLAPSELQATMLCCEVMTSRNESEAAVAEAVKAREIAGAASDIAKRTAAELEKRAPKVNP